MLTTITSAGGRALLLAAQQEGRRAVVAASAAALLYLLPPAVRAWCSALLGRSLPRPGGAARARVHQCAQLAACCLGALSEGAQQKQQQHQGKQARSKKAAAAATHQNHAPARQHSRRPRKGRAEAAACDARLSDDGARLAAARTAACSNAQQLQQEVWYCSY